MFFTSRSLSLNPAPSRMLAGAAGEYEGQADEIEGSGRFCAPPLTCSLFLPFSVFLCEYKPERNCGHSSQLKVCFLIILSHPVGLWLLRGAFVFCL